MKKILVILIIIAFIASVGTIVSAQSGSITDPTGDVMHYRWHEGGFGWFSVENKPDIDITEVKYVVTGDIISLSLTVDGAITNSELVSYHVHLLTSDSSYIFTWVDGEGNGVATSTAGDDFQYSEADITVSGNTITATYDVVGTFTTVEEFYGYAIEYTVIGDTSIEWWMDYAPNDESPYQPSDPSDPPGNDETTPPPTGNGETTDPTNGNGTPGFELLAVLVALGAALILIKKRE